MVVFVRGIVLSLNFLIFHISIYNFFMYDIIKILMRNVYMASTILKSSRNG